MIIFIKFQEYLLYTKYHLHQLFGLNKDLFGLPQVKLYFI